VKERVRDRLLELGERAAAGAMGAAFVSTFHAYCARLLRSHPLGAGVEPGFEILDEGLAARAAEPAFADALRTLVSRRGDEAVDLLAAYGPERLRAMVVRVHSELRARGQRRPRLPEAIAGAGAEAIAGAGAEGEAVRACALLDELLCGFGDRYEERKRARGALDFDGLELRALELLREREAVRALWSRRFELLMIDEFQDTNPRQLAILRALERGNLFTVGDELQSIYGFRDADVSVVDEAATFIEGLRPESQPRQAITVSFRAKPELLSFVNDVFDAMAQESASTRRDGFRYDERDRFPSRGVGVEGNRVGFIAADSAKANAELVADEIVRLLSGATVRDRTTGVARDAQPADIAILFRSRDSHRDFESALERRGVSTARTAACSTRCAERFRAGCRGSTGWRRRKCWIV
jgi:ATP-dependent exoDNAse (exonuclease V) beta subunit